MKVSTALRNAILADNSLKAALGGFVIRVYEGTAPASPDDAIPAGATQLVEISLDDTGNELALANSAAGGTIAKDSGQVWEGTVGSSGLAEFFRIVKPADDGSSSSAAVRIQGTVGTAGEDMNFSDPSLTENAVQRVEFLNITLPMT